jgi:hypothetical protein
MPATTKYLAIYLNDHLAGAMVGVELSSRAASGHEDHASGPELAVIAREIAEDREALVDVMQRLDIERGHVKPALAWVGEKLGRLKLNGELTGSSPLSLLIEVEGLVLGVTGKLALWHALEQAAGEDPRLAGVDLQELLARAESQRERLEALRRSAALEALVE